MIMPIGAVILAVIALVLAVVGLRVMPSMHDRIYYGQEDVVRNTVKVAKGLWIVALALSMPFFIRIVLDAIVG